MPRQPTHAAPPPRSGRRALLVGLLGLLAPLAIACADASSTGAVAKDFPMLAYQGQEALGGRETTFATVFRHGQPVVLNFWAGQCPPCRAEMPHFQRVADEYRGRVLFVGLDVGPFTGLGTREDARRLLDELQIRYPAAAATDAEPLRLFGVRSMPTTVFFDPQGRIVEQVPGLVLEPQLRRVVQQLVEG